MTMMAGAVLVVALLVLAFALLDGGPTVLPRRITTDDRPRPEPSEPFEIAVTDHRGDVDDVSSRGVGMWLAAGGVLLAAVVAALVGAEG